MFLMRKSLTLIGRKSVYDFSFHPPFKYDIATRKYFWTLFSDILMALTNVILMAHYIRVKEGVLTFMLK